ncbi:putative PH domain-containing protein [Neospora caninum Liverpool]|nr:putative PH domain-containing protein [Neospora caninum Liverpool]CBZ49666.1 putative PH domain-containing protein [Neospora caninum Liverpool]|eukprot:XP_003879701.1 putative PH domain-containing protein [Neospora caninum Liverpool]
MGETDSDEEAEGEVLEFCGESFDSRDDLLMGDESEELLDGEPSVRAVEDEDSSPETAATETVLSPEDALFEGGVHPRRRTASDDSVAALQEFTFLYQAALRKRGISCCGYLKKRSPNRLVGWQRRWFVLKDKRLLYYRQPEDRTPAGRIDLELVKIKIQCLWNPRQFHGGLLCRSGSMLEPLTPGYSAATGWMELLCCGSGPKGSQLLVAANDLQEEVRFRLKPVGCTRVFELAGPYVEVVNWIDKLRQVVKSCHVSRHYVRRVAQQRGFWKVERISPDKFEEIVDTGDIILFRTKKFPAQLQRAVTRGHYDHVGMMLRNQDKDIFILESMGDTGVIITSWKTFVKAKWYTAYRKVVLRRLRWSRQPESLSRLLAFLQKVVGRNYELTFSKLFATGVAPDKPDKGYFCSELVAAALKEIGALPEDTKCARYWPHTFAAGSALKLSEGFELDEELLVDFCLRSKARKRHGPKKLEGRTVPLPKPPLQEELTDTDRVPLPPDTGRLNSFLGCASAVGETEAPLEETPSRVNEAELHIGEEMQVV